MDNQYEAKPLILVQQDGSVIRLHRHKTEPHRYLPLGEACKTMNWNKRMAAHLERKHGVHPHE